MNKTLTPEARFQILLEEATPEAVYNLLSNYLSEAEGEGKGYFRKMSARKLLSDLVLYYENQELS